MNLQKAKEIIDLNIKEADPKMPPDVLTALKLHSEAVKEIMSLRDDLILPMNHTLPGETKD